MKSINNNKKEEKKNFIKVDGIDHEYGSVINYTSTHKFNLWNRVKLLFGSVFTVKADIYVKETSVNCIPGGVAVNGVVHTKTKKTNA